MIPLRITARIASAISLPGGPIALDSLLMSQVALRRQLPPPRTAADCEHIDIPIALEPEGRFYLCSFSSSRFEQHELRYVNRRAPVEQYQTVGERRIKRVQITSGQNKSYRIPLEVGHVEGDTLTWFAIGECDAVGALLASVSHLGRKRSVGLGRVVGWTVEPCEPWGEGFPVVRDGKPLRTLPADYPGLLDPPLAHRCLMPPYWDYTREEIAACPS